MAKRTMTISRLYYHPFGKPDDHGQMSDLPDGRDLADMFERFVTTDVEREKLVKRTTESYSAITHCERRGRAILVTTKAGRFGEEGTIEDINTHQEIARYGHNDATAVTTHGVLLVPAVGDSALAFVERSGGHGGMAPIVDLFIETFAGHYHSHRMKRETVTQTDAWLESAKLEQVTATVRNYSPDIADGGGDDEVLGDLRHVFAPPGREKFLPRKILEKLLDKKINRSKYLGFRDDARVDSIEIKLGDGEQSKTFEIGHDKTPSLRLVLSSGGAAPTKELVFKRALDEAAEVFAHYGIEWGQSEALAG